MESRFHAISMMMTRCDIISVSYTSERKNFVSAVAAMLDGRSDNVANSRLPHAKQAAPEMAVRNDVLADHASGVHRYGRASRSAVRGDAMKPSGAQARNLITQGFDSLHRLGDKALKSRDSLTDPEQK